MLTITGRPLDISTIVDSPESKDIAVVCDDGRTEANILVLSSISPMLCSILAAKYETNDCSIILPGAQTKEISTLFDLCTKGKCYVTQSSLARLDDLKVSLGVSIATQKVSITIEYIYNVSLNY